MQWFTIITLFILSVFTQYNTAKESSTYQLSDVELVDLLRGYIPKGKVQLTKVDTNVGILPDGVYFVPEDEALTGESKYLELNGQKRRV